MQKITPFLWFEKGAEEAAAFYVSVFNRNPGKNIESFVDAKNKYDEASSEASGQPIGSVMIVSFELEGQAFTAINGGPVLQFTGAISFVVECKTQDEIDYFWEKLGEGGEMGQCGWINRDKFGVTWQIVPEALPTLLSDADGARSERVMKAMLKMTKINIDDLQKAYDRV